MCQPPLGPAVLKVSLLALPNILLLVARLLFDAEVTSPRLPSREISFRFVRPSNSADYLRSTSKTSAEQGDREVELLRVRALPAGGLTTKAAKQLDRAWLCSINGLKSK